MKSVRSVLNLFVVLVATAGAPSLAAGAGSVSHGGGFGGYQRPPSVPQAHQYAPQPRRPVFGSGGSLSVPPTGTRPHLSARPASPNASVPSHNFRGQNIDSLGVSYRNVWNHGHWHHGRYHGEYGWWWFVAGYWYWYQEPIFPYPDYISEEVEPDTDDEEPADATPPAGLQGDVYYYCGDPSGYFPYVATCNLPWETVPAAPPQ